MKKKCQKGYKYACGTCKHLSNGEFDQTCEECYQRYCPLDGDLTDKEEKECKGCLWEPADEH